MPATKTLAKKSIAISNGSSKNGKTVKSKITAKIEHTLEDLFEDNLRDIYNAEKQLVAALPLIAKSTYSEDLENAINDHLNETKKQMERLEKIFDRLDMDTRDVNTCEAMEGLITECKEVMDHFEDGPVRDAALIIAAQKIEHYEIAAYGSLCELADVLGYSKIADILERSLNEEKSADRILSHIAQDVNDEACEMTEELV